MSLAKRLMQRIRRLPASVRDLGLEDDLALVQLSEESGWPDEDLARLVSERLDELEGSLLHSPFITPPGPIPGAVQLGSTFTGDPVGVDLARGANPVQHFLLSGAVGTGKSATMASIALQARDVCDVVVLDSQSMFARIPEIAASGFEFIDVKRDLRLNPLDPLDGLGPFEQHHAFAKGLAETYGLKWSEQELLRALTALEGTSRLHVRGVLAYLEAKTYRGFSNRSRLRDSILLQLGYLADALYPTLDCRRGMDFSKILTRGAVVLRLDGIGIEHQAWIARFAFDYVFLLRRAQRGLQRPLLVLADEAQALLEHGEGMVADRLLQARHARLHFAFGVQVPSRVSPTVSGNCDCHLVGGLVDSECKRRVQRTLGLTSDQVEYLSQQRGPLNTGEVRGGPQVVCALPRSPFKRPFVLQLPWMDIEPVAAAVPTPAFVQDLAWEGLEETVEPQSPGSMERGAPVGTESRASAASRLDEETERFVSDVLVQGNECSTLSQRFERARVRSAERQRQIMKRVLERGLVKTESLAVGRGRPWTLAEPTEVLLTERGVRWKKGRGGLATRVATSLLEKKIEGLEGWTCVREGRWGPTGKQVDLLLRDPVGRVVTAEIAGNPRHELHNVLACVPRDEAGTREWRGHVVVAVSASVRDAVKKKFAAIPELSGDRRIEVLALSQALSKKWVPGGREETADGDLFK